MCACGKYPRVLSILTGRRGGEARGRDRQRRATIHTAGDHETVPLDTYACTAARMPQQRYQREVRRATVASRRFAAPRDAARTRRRLDSSMRDCEVAAPRARTRAHRLRRRLRAPFSARVSDLGALEFEAPLLYTSVYQPLQLSPFLPPPPSSSCGFLDYAHLS